MVEGIIKEF